MPKRCKGSVRTCATICIVKSLQKTIQILFGVLLFLVPLVLWPFTSELFEFNKMILVYLITVAIVFVWGARMIYEKKFIFRRTILDIPFIVFLGSQLISTLLSIDPLTSWLGYYSRFNGGLLSSICYILLYWAFVSNIDRRGVIKLIKTTLVSAVIVSIYGVLERLGIDKNIWQQDVQHRVFSTLGQPNWLSAWLVALIPLSWAFMPKGDEKITKQNAFGYILPYFLSFLFFTTILFTGSRSGLLGFAVADLCFWAMAFWKYKSRSLKPFLISNSLAVVAILLFGTQWIGSLIAGNQIPIISKLFTKSQTTNAIATQAGGTALENGGTESGEIRKIVWQGAIDIWKNYPIFGTGVETFAYSYYLFRPAAHNMTSEWDFIYNKAHNEYLNFMANTGTFGILAYLAMIGFALYLMVRGFWIDSGKSENGHTLISAAFISGYLSILVTNYFGFSVVPIQILFFLYPAFSNTLDRENLTTDQQKVRLNGHQKFGIITLLSFSIFLLFTICRYWYADVLYASGLNYNRANRQDLALPYLEKATKLEPKQPLFYSEISRSYTALALAYSEANQATVSAQLAELAINNSIKSVDLSPANVNFKRVEFGVFIMLASTDPNYLLDARDVLITAIKQAPTDAKIFYNLGLTYIRLGQNDLAMETLKKTVDLKPNYADARLAYAALLANEGEASSAREQAEYVLKYIDPKNPQAKQFLENSN